MTTTRATKRSTQTVLASLLRAGLALGLLGAGACDKAGGEAAILDLDPKVGATQGDQPVKVIGENFRQDIGYTVYFGTQKAGSLTIFDPQTLLVTTPSGVQPGTVDVMIRADDGNAWRLPKAFEFKDMGGSVVEGMGQVGAGKKKGNLAF